MKKTLLLLCGLVISFQLLEAQITAPPLSIPTPEATSFTKYGNIPVSMYDGTANVEIKLAEINTGKIKFPISITYNTGGVLPDQHPGWVGSNWHMNIGGMISRVVNSLPDEVDNIKFPQKGFYFNYSKLDSTNWAVRSSIQNKLAADYEERFMYTFNSNLSWKDYEPDEFYFSFLGYTGKFFLDHHGQFQVQCEKKLKVVFDTADFIFPKLYYDTTINFVRSYINKTFSKFTIIDEFGTKYLFGTDTAIEYSDAIHGRHLTWLYQDEFGQPVTTIANSRGAFHFATSWKLKKITTHDGIELATFYYVRGPFTHSIYSSSFRQTIIINGSTTGASWGSLAAGKFLSPVYLQTIEFPAHKVKIKFTISKSHELALNKPTFYAVGGYNYGQGYTSTEEAQFYDLLNNTTGLDFFGETPASASSLETKLDRMIWGKLDKIQVINSISNDTTQSFHLIYTDTSTQRLFLKEIQTRDMANAPVHSYKLFYDGTALPAYNSQSNDAAGYHNGKSLPSGSDWSYDTLKISDLVKAKAGVLTKIEYPSGGITQFEYELHQYSKAVSANRYTVNNVSKTSIGGLRIKKISDVARNGDTLSKEYFYVRNYRNGLNIDSLECSGVITAVPRFDLGTMYGTGEGSGGQPYTYTHKAGNPLVPLTSSDNENVVTYTEVVEKLSDASYNIYVYTNHDNGHKDQPPVDTVGDTRFFYLPAISLQHHRGKLLSTQVYKNDNTKIKETSVSYSVVGDSSIYGRLIFSRFKQLFGYNVARVYGGCSRKLYYYSFLPSRITDTIFSQEGKIFVSKQFLFDNDTKVSLKEETIKSNGDTLIAMRYYPFHFDTLANVYQEMTQKNMIDYPVEEKIILQNGSSYIKQGTIINYKEYSSDKIFPDSVFKFRSHDLVSSSSVTPTTFNGRLLFDSRYKHELDYRGYNSLGNPIEIYSKESGVVSYIWDYFENYPVAIVNNATNEAMAHTSFESNGDGNWEFNGTPVIDATSPTGSKCYYLSNTTILASSNALAHSETYIVSYWSKNGAYSISGISYLKQGPTLNGWTYYEHQITNRSSADFSGTGYVDEVRLYPKSAQMTTYTYIPIIGIRSKCDMANRITYYEYDDFGRLKQIKDENGKILKHMDYKYLATNQQ